MEPLATLYQDLLKTYGHQGWWPISSLKTATTAHEAVSRGYHPGDYSYPHGTTDQFEICLGAILTQNTAWTNVEKALDGLANYELLQAEKLIKVAPATLAEIIRPSGYYQQKSKKLQIFGEFYRKLNGRCPSREELLDIWGIGKETADSILLYAYGKPTFVIDTYTKRLLLQLGLIDMKATYDTMQKIFTQALDQDVALYQEYHALIVAHSKHLAKSRSKSPCSPHI